MKNIFTISLILLCISSFGQTCADQWERIFEERGAYHVPNEMHRDVIIFIEENGEGRCYNGKARVENGYITTMLVLLENGEFVPVEGEFVNIKGAKGKVKDGMSEWLTDKNGRRIRVFFPAKIKPKAPEMKEAPSPEDWLKNN